MLTHDDILTAVTPMMAEPTIQKIVLFGSQATGEATEDSDVDLLIVAEFEGRGFEYATWLSLRLDLPFPCDIIAFTPQRFEQRLAVGDPLLKVAVSEGITLYDRVLGRVA